MSSMGTAIIIYIALALVVFPILALVFPRQAVLTKSSNALLERNPSYRSLINSDETALLIQLLRLPDSWVSTQVSKAYLLSTVLLALLVGAGVLFLHISVLLGVVAFFVLDLTVIPLAAVAIGRNTLKTTFKKAAGDYRITVVYSLILVASQIRGTTTTDNAIGNLATLLPSTTVQRFVNDVAIFRTNSGGDASTGKTLRTLGEVWDIPSCILIGDILDSGLDASDIADQMLSQVELAYLNQLDVDHKKYQSRETIMNTVVMGVFSIASLVAIYPILTSLLSKGGF